MPNNHAVTVDARIMIYPLPHNSESGVIFTEINSEGEEENRIIYMSPKDGQ